MPIWLSASVLLVGFRGYYFTSSYLIGTDIQPRSGLWYNIGSRMGIFVPFYHTLTFKELFAKIR
ncbi:MAG: hypothetical protein IJR13_05625, partial [Bacteroidales bacterium]|nr:hypothetical protein [Bacteroidales bacterium]